MKKERRQSLKKLDARVRHAIDTNAIGFSLTGIKSCKTVANRLYELQSAGVVTKIVDGSPGICYF